MEICLVDFLLDQRILVAEGLLKRRYEWRERNIQRSFLSRKGTCSEDEITYLPYFLILALSRV